METFLLRILYLVRNRSLHQIKNIYAIFLFLDNSMDSPRVTKTCPTRPIDKRGVLRRAKGNYILLTFKIDNSIPLNQFYLF